MATSPRPLLKTDSTGKASNTLVAAPNLPLGASFFQSQINAVYINKSVTFTETVVGQFQGGSTVGLSLRTPALGYTFVGAAGQHSSTLIQVIAQGTLGSQSGQPVPHLQIHIGPNDIHYTATLTCAEGPSVFTDTHGLAVCTPVFGGAIGFGVVQVNAVPNLNNLGGILGQFFFNYQVTAGPPAIIAIVSGNNQSGQPGVTLPRTLVAQVTDIAGNSLPGVPLVFKAVVPGTVAFGTPNINSDSHGLVQTTATPGSVSGPVQVSVQTTDGKVFATFTINVAVKVGQILKSGDQQTGTTLQPFADALTVTVHDPNGNPIEGAQVTFAVTQGAATLGSPTAVTNDAGSGQHHCSRRRRQPDHS